MSDSFRAFKLSSYTPNTIIISPSSAPHITSNPYYCLCADCTNHLSFNIHHLGEEEGGVTTSNSRWTPTPAQLLYLEQLYTQGTKTPTAQQIQLIASQLRHFGNIQAKNVFYWFQNHKARDRHYHKRRSSDLQITSPPAFHQQQQKDHFTQTLMLQSPHDAFQGLRGTGYEVKESNVWNCSALAQVSDSLNRAGRGAYRRTQREERETQILRMKSEENREAKCQIKDMCYFLSNSKNLIKSIANTSTTTHHTQTSNPANSYCHEEDEEVADHRTLKLFPLKRSDEDDDDECTESSKRKFCSFNNTASMDSEEITSNQFFEFLPLRN
ncbi:hypothetical protein QN277_029310 [Acacia crassicarpa]|uniref:Homeobox domain-containing protein n=1 Tax=Acacia crassicarpa TaxID=499986 RepID=A0AAE1MG74_9FABA|nr:hypothetical protein QN277_029310 [Acacia crassicarpa]